MTSPVNGTGEGAGKSQRRRIRGTIQISGVQQPCEADVYVRLEEVSRADAAATRVTETVLRGVQLRPGFGAIPFELQDVSTKPGGRYAVRVHVDVDRDGKVSRGDYVSTQSHCMTSTDYDTPFNIVVREVQ